MSDTQTPLLDAGTPVTRGWKGMSGWQRLALGGAVAGAAIAFIVAPIWSDGAPPRQEEKETRAPAKAEPFHEVNYPPPSSGGGTDSGPPSSESSRPRVVVRRRPPPIAISSYQGGTTSAATPTGNHGTGQGQAMVATGSEGGGMHGASQGNGEASTSLAGQLGSGVDMPTAHARYSPNPDYIIGANTNIPCLPVETHNTGLGGFATCRVPEWVRGETQRIGLLPPGTLIKGQIRGGMAQGQPRIGVLYRQIVTAGDRFSISMQALGGDAQGRSGLDADVKTFFWETAGAVALYALIQGTTTAIPQAAAAALQRGDNNSYTQFMFGGLGQGGQSLANTALQHRLNRPPEAERPWALPMFVTVGHDLDFTTVCRDRRRLNPMACPRM